MRHSTQGQLFEYKMMPTLPYFAREPIIQTSKCVLRPFLLIYFKNNINDKKKGREKENNQKHPKFHLPTPFFPTDHQLVGKVIKKSSSEKRRRHLNQDGRIGEEGEEDDADHCEAPNLQRCESCREG